MDKEVFKKLIKGRWVIITTRYRKTYKGVLKAVDKDKNYAKLELFEKDGFHDVYKSDLFIDLDNIVSFEVGKRY